MKRLYLFIIPLILLVSLLLFHSYRGDDNNALISAPGVLAENPEGTSADYPAETPALGGLEIDVPITKETEALNYTFSYGDTLFVLLLNHGLTRAEAQAAVDAFSGNYDPRKIRTGTEFSVFFAGEENKLASFVVEVEPVKQIWVFRGEAEGFYSEVKQKELIKKQTLVEGRIDSTLYGAALQAGLPPGILSDLIYLYSFDIDFQREIQTGDSFSILFDEYTDEEGRRVRLGDIAYASLTVSGGEKEIYRYTPKKGDADYFDPSGKSARKTLLKTPINGAYISSGYGMRVSPILGYSRFHPALDFAAPEGTPVFTAGDGVVTALGRDDVYGRYIKIAHANSYATLYAHLSRYVSGIRKGSKVSQGSTIGYVGSTGMSTGPHLHYEVHYQGKQINPAILNFPPGKTLKGEELENYREVKAGIWLNHAILKGFPGFDKFRKNLLP